MNITIEKNVSTINADAFTNCYKLVEVYNKSSITIEAGSRSNGNIGYYAKTVYTQPYTSKVSTDENGFVLYTDGDLVSLIGYTGPMKEHLIIPSAVTEINQFAFCQSYSNTTVTIPSSVTTIGRGAFQNCAVTKVIFENPSGWQYGHGAQIFSAADLTNEIAAANYLTYSFNNDVWTRDA